LDIISILHQTTTKGEELPVNTGVLSHITTKLFLLVRKEVVKCIRFFISDWLKLNLRSISKNQFQI